MTETKPIQYNVIIKRSVLLSGHRTSVSLEEAFWLILKDLCQKQKKSINQLVSEIDNARIERPNGNLSSTIRVYILEQLTLK
jgi:predicted DNA-binding ribbon-helix-helix protein